jgi:hypothetical protein
MDIAQVESTFQEIEPAQNGVWRVKELSPERLYATRSGDGAYGLFIIGELGEFGSIPRSIAIVHATDVRIEPEGRSVAALRFLPPPSHHADRAVVFFAYEASELLLRDSQLSNEHLIHRLAWMLGLLGDEGIILTPERQIGLVAELHLLARLVRHSHSKGRPGWIALRNWHGSSPAKRDFACPGIAVEVKATKQDARIHNISSLQQLDPAHEDESVFVYSIGVRHDYSAPRKLKHFVEDIEVLLAPDELDEFHKQLAEYGFNASHTELYESEPGIAPFHLSPAFFAERAMVRLRAESFVGGEPPATVLNVAYRLLITSDPVQAINEVDILDRLLVN